MIQEQLIKILLFPFSILYGLGVSLRNFFYKTKMLKSVKFDIPIISVGNLSVGGAGKSPHIEYLIRLLQPYLNIATLSRGYKRKTEGFLIVDENANAEQAGDEPVQFKQKYPETVVAVAENRVLAIPKMLMQSPDIQVVLLDDAFQHRAITPGFNILLTEYSRPFTRDYLLPMGRLREEKAAYKRADIIIVTKCPPTMTIEEKTAFIKEIKPFDHQKIYFSYYRYANPYAIFNNIHEYVLNININALLLSGIARADYLVDYLKETITTTKVMEYEDHHYFSDYDLRLLKSNFDKMEGKNKIILTTEKDAMRLALHKNFIESNQLPIFVLPIEVAFHFEEGIVFDEEVKRFLLNFKV